MSKRQCLCLLGIWIIIFLFLGLPASWHQIIAIITGIIIVIIAYNLPHERVMNNDTYSSSYVENNNSGSSE